MIRFVVELGGNDPDEARKFLLKALSKGHPGDWWHTRIKDFECVRIAVNNYENDPTTISKLQTAICEVFSKITGSAP